MRMVVAFVGVVVILFRVGPSLAFRRLALKCLTFSGLDLRRLARRIFRLVSLCCFVQVISFVRCRWRKTRQNQGF